MSNKRISPDIAVETHAAIKAAAEGKQWAVNKMAANILNQWALDHEKKNKPKAKKEVVVSNSEAQQVIDQYSQIMRKRCKLTPNREVLINGRLKDCGYEMIIQAIHGCTKSSHHMGQNDRNTAYNSIEFICRSVENIEKFTQNMGVIQRETNQSGNTKLSTVEAAKQNLQRQIDEFESPGGNGQILDMDDRNLF